jgi:hypothetical protein
MNIDEIVKRISKTDGLSKTLGMKFISTPEPDTIMATMKVDERNRQPFGFLSGGASLALAENVAGTLSGTHCRGHQRERHPCHRRIRGRHRYRLRQVGAQGKSAAHMAGGHTQLAGRDRVHRAGDQLCDHSEERPTQETGRIRR